MKKIINYFKIKKEKKDFQCLLKTENFDAGMNKEGVWNRDIVQPDGTITELIENNLENPIAFMNLSTYVYNINGVSKDEYCKYYLTCFL